MKIKLPSNFGLRVVNMRKPTMGDLRSSHYENPVGQYRKLKFIQSLLAPKTDLTKITLWDAEYLFALAAFVVQYNQILYNVTCPFCGGKFQHVMSLREQEVVESDKDLSKTSTFNYDGQKYTVRTLTMQDGLDACDYGFLQDDFDQGYNDYLVYASMLLPIKRKGLLGWLGKTYTPMPNFDDVAKVSELPPRVYMAVFINHQLHYHGMQESQLCTCRQCKKEVTLRTNVDIDFIDSLTPEMMMKVYAHLAGKITISDFMAISNDELKTITDELTSMLEKMR